MGLAANQVQLLMLTRRKSDCEFSLSMDHMQKLSLTREQTELSREYNSRLQSKNLAVYHNGQYQKLNSNYFIGGVRDSFVSNLISGNGLIKKDNSMVLTDYKGRVVLNLAYADVLNEMGISGGKTFSLTNEMCAEFLCKVMNKDNAKLKNAFTSLLNGGAVNYTIACDVITALGGEKTGTEDVVVASAKETLQKIADFYLPILRAAGANGWTTEYEKEMNQNEDYVNDALLSGSFQLAKVNSDGNYCEDASLTYFINSGSIDARNDSETRAEITAWYDAEKARISEKESYLDLDISNLSTELEAIKTEIESIKSLINDAINVFNWGGDG